MKARFEDVLRTELLAIAGRRRVVRELAVRDATHVEVEVSLVEAFFISMQVPVDERRSLCDRRNPGSQEMRVGFLRAEQAWGNREAGQEKYESSHVLLPRLDR